MDQYEGSYVVRSLSLCLAVSLSLFVRSLVLSTNSTLSSGFTCLVLTSGTPFYLTFSLCFLSTFLSLFLSLSLTHRELENARGRRWRRCSSRDFSSHLCIFGIFANLGERKVSCRDMETRSRRNERGRANEGTRNAVFSGADLKDAPENFQVRQRDRRARDRCVRK